MNLSQIIKLSCLIACLLQNACVPVAAITAAKVGSIALEERTPGRVVDDTVIMTKIKQKFASHSPSKILTKTSVDVLEGRVLLTGSVGSYEDVTKAIKLAWSVDGVQEVISELEVERKDIKARAKDRLIATQIRTKLLFRSNVKSLNYTIDVNNGNAYILGIAQSVEELDEVIECARTVSGVHKVVNYTRIRENK